MIGQSGSKSSVVDGDVVERAKRVVPSTPRSSIVRRVAGDTPADLTWLDPEKYAADDVVNAIRKASEVVGHPHTISDGGAITYVMARIVTW